MVAPSYTEDLTDIDLAEAVGNYVATGGGGAGLSADPDFAVEGTNSITKQVSNARKGILFNNGSGIAIPAGDHVFVWIYCTTPGLLDTLAVGGMCVSIGNGTGDRNEFHIVGATEYAQGGWLCVPIKYVLTGNGSHPYRTLVGTPSGDPQYFGVIVDTTDTVKAVNSSVDAMRYGTGAYITAGDGGDPATFAGFAALNDAISARWGILAAIAGGYALQGRFVIGQDTGQTPTAAYFDDSNTLVVLVDTFHSETDFTQIIIDHASTTFNLTNVTILALGTINPGRLVFNDASITSALIGCVFDGIGITTLRAGVTATGCTWRTAAAITQNGATLDGCVIEENSAAVALLSDDIELITDCEFISDGTGHAVEYRPTGAGPFNVDWSGNQDSGYAGSDGNTGNETILIHPVTNDADITLNIIDGATTPTIMEHGDYTGTLTIVINPVTTTITVKDVTDQSLIQYARVFLEAADGTGDFNFEESVSIAQSGGTATVDHTGHGLDSNEWVHITGCNEKDYNLAAQITVLDVDTYTYTVYNNPSSPATGTPVSTTVMFNHLTDVNGEVEDLRSLSLDQKLAGVARKSTSTPLYKTSPIVETVDKSLGLSVNILLIPDE